MLFAVICTDKPDSLSLRLSTRPDHLIYLESLGDRVRLGGALLAEDQSGALGSLLILEGETLEEIENFTANDPYAKANLFAHVTIKPWRQAVGIPLA